MRVLFVLGAAACLLLVPSTAHSQSCDVMVLNGSWSTHPDPDSIYVNFYPDVTSDDPANPRLYDVMINIRVDNVLVDDWDAHLRWAHGYQCVSNCPPDVCEEKEWTYKGEIKRSTSKCKLASPTFCYCPVALPPKERKPIPKPTAPGLIEIEIVPLNLQSCNPINPGNDRVQFNYPGFGPSPDVPAAPPALVLSLVTGFLGLAYLTLRARRRVA